MFVPLGIWLANTHAQSSAKTLHCPGHRIQKASLAPPAPTPAFYSPGQETRHRGLNQKGQEEKKKVKEAGVGNKGRGGFLEYTGFGEMLKNP